ncbi:unnamed protein product [Ascophyllum nodosum]
MIEMGMKGWEDETVGLPSYAYAGQVDSAQPIHAADQILYFAENESVVVIEPSASFFRVYDSDAMHLRRQYEIKVENGTAQALCYSKTTGCYVLGTSASRVCLYEEHSGRAWRTFETPTTPVCIAYPERYGLIIAGDMIGNLFAWKAGDVLDANFDDSEPPPHGTFGGSFKTKRILADPDSDGYLSLSEGHTDAVMSILNLADSGTLASCGLDHTIKLWDISTLTLRNTLLGHMKGVRHMAYCPDHQLIVSGGFCFDLVVNNPSVSTPISYLRGHSAPIVGVEHILGTSQASNRYALITADTDGACKLWDLRTFSCAQTFTTRAMEFVAKRPKKSINFSCAVVKREPVIACMAASLPYQRVLVGGRIVGCFKVVRDERDDITDDAIVLTVWFNKTNLTFVTASARAVKVWDAATGKLRCVDARISPPEKGPKSELTSFCPGTGGRKIITGEAKGGIKVFNHVNNVELKSFEYHECNGRAHEGDVRALIFIEEHTLLISASSDRSIAVHDESQRDSGTLLRRMTEASWSEITAIQYSAHFGLIASGNVDGSIQLWNFELGRHEGCCAERHPSPVTSLTFLDPFPVLLSADSAGYLALWALPPAREGLRFSRIFTWINRQPVTSRMYGSGGGGCDGHIPVAVTVMECQVEMITTSSAVSTTYTTPSETSFLGGDGDNSSLQLSHEQSDRRADCQDDATGAREMGGKDGDGEGEQQSLGQGGNGMETAPTPLGSTDGDVEGNKRDGVCGGTSVDLLERNTTKSRSESLTSSASNTDYSSGGSRGRSFQEHLMATIQKYQGVRRSYPGHEETCRSEAPKQQILWNTEMLAYTLYTADDMGRVTTWDLKPLLLNLAQIYGGNNLNGHGVGVVRSPVVYSNVFLKSRYDARAVLHGQRCRLEAQPTTEWIPDLENLGLHRIDSWEAHSDPIVCMHLVDNPPTVITAAMDRLVKLWSPTGEPWGVLRPNQKSETPWMFRPDRKKQETQKVRAAEDLMLALKLFWGECAPKTSPRRRRVSFGATGENDISNSIREDSLGDVGSGRYDQSLWDDTETCRPRKYAEEELDRLINGTKSSKFFAPSSQEFSKSRRTPRRVPVRPNNAGRGLSKKTVVDRSASASLRTMRGQLVVSQRLNKW